MRQAQPPSRVLCNWGGSKPGLGASEGISRGSQAAQSSGPMALSGLAIGASCTSPPRTPDMIFAERVTCGIMRALAQSLDAQPWSRNTDPNSVGGPHHP